MISADDENHEFDEIVGTEYKEPIEWVLIRDYREEVHVKIIRSKSVPPDALNVGFTKTISNMKEYWTPSYFRYTKKMDNLFKKDKT